MQVVAHNLESQFSNHHLNVTSKEKAKSTEKLSSGYRINRSADDLCGTADFREDKMADSGSGQNSG